MTEMPDKAEYIRKFREMWNWIADETEKRKRKVWKVEYFYENNINLSEAPYSHCYICEYVKRRNEYEILKGTDLSKEHVCLYCPIQWSNSGFSTCNKEIYRDWYETGYWKTASDLARKIANLPEREDV